MKHKDDSLEWHDENELVRRLDVVEAVLNLADTIDDVVDVIMSVPTHKVYTTTNVAMGSGGVSTTKDRKTENSSEIPNNCEPKPCEWCKFYDGENCFSKEPCKVMLYFKDEPQTDAYDSARFSHNCIGICENPMTYIAKVEDEPQTERSE